MHKTKDFSKNRNTIRTDLSFLLECLKLQMKCPDLQKQALLTIHSICEKREDNVDLLREMGGVAFLYNLSKSSIVHSDVKETALFTLGTLAEASVFCKNFLCRKETFTDLVGWLMKEDNLLTTKRVSVYLLTVLVANNKSGQSLAQTTGGLDILLDLFRTTFPLSEDATVNATQTHQLWTSVSSALCGCVNNPQNEEGQRICAAAFPLIKIWLHQVALTSLEIFQSICSFIAMTVANNCDVQESFSASGGLEALTLSLLRLAPMADTSSLSCQLSVIISRTLSACIIDNSALASELGQFGIVSKLLSLLVSPNLDPEDRLSVLLTLGHCTECCEDHQYQLVQCGGLPLIITLLAEDTSEEVKRAATFILQTCKQATMSLKEPHLTERHGEAKSSEPHPNMESFRSSAKELLYRINLLEQKQAKAEDEQEDKDPPVLPSPSPALPLQHKESMPMFPAARKQITEARDDNSFTLQNIRNTVTKETSACDLKNENSYSDTEVEKGETSERDIVCSVCKGSRLMLSSNALALEGGRVPHTAYSQLFKPPAPLRHSAPKDIIYIDEELQGWDMSEVNKIKAEEYPLSHCRCAGCVLPFEEVTSRTFASLQSSCHHSCDIHRALQAATERFRTRHCSLLLQRRYQDDSVSAEEPQGCQEYPSEKVTLTPICKGAGKVKSFPPEHKWKKHKAIALTPLRRDKTEKTDKGRLLP